MIDSVWEGARGKARLKDVEEADAPIHDYNDGTWDISMPLAASHEPQVPPSLCRTSCLSIMNK
jgi:hypothetical protein